MERQYRGFTFIEVLLALALSVLFLSFLVSFVWRVSDINEKRRLSHMVSDEARYIDERLNMLIRTSDGISEIKDDYLVLEQSGSSDTTTIFLRDGALFVVNGNDEEALTGADVFISSLSFVRYGSTSGGPRSVGYEITLDANPNRVGENALLPMQLTVHGAALIRSIPHP